MLRCGFVALVMVAPTTAEARTWHITPDATGDAPTIQAGIDSSAAGDTVLLADGTYSGIGNREIRYHGKALVVRSESGHWSACSISPSQEQFDDYRGFIFDSGEEEASILEGVTISGCGYYYAGDLDGAGIYCSGSWPTIRNVRLWRNSGGRGGGMACEDASPTLEDVTFVENSAWEGGGLFCTGQSSPYLRSVSFAENDASTVGGGMACSGESSPFLEVVTFGQNRAHDGGGIFCWGECSPALTQVNFIENDVWHPDGGGGGMFCSIGTAARLGRVTFSGNRAGYGGGLACEGAIVRLTTCEFSSNVATENGGAVYSEGDASVNLVASTLALNCAASGAAIYSSGAAVVIDRALIVESAGGDAVWSDAQGYVWLECCDLFGNAGGDWVGSIAGQCGINGNFAADPKFCGVPGPAFMLEDCSPCLPGNHPAGYDCRGAIGAYGAGCSCGTAVEPTTWGGIKASYK